MEGGASSEEARGAGKELGGRSLFSASREQEEGRARTEAVSPEAPQPPACTPAPSPGQRGAGEDAPRALLHSRLWGLGWGEGGGPNVRALELSPEKAGECVQRAGRGLEKGDKLGDWVEVDPVFNP